MSNRESGLDWEQSLRDALGVCHTVSKAYEIALFLGEISRPDIGYRRVLETVKIKGACTVSQMDGKQAATIVKVKHY